MIIATCTPFGRMPVRMTVFDFRIGPGSDPGFLVLGDVWRRHLERRLVPGQASREVLAGDNRGTFRRMAIATGQDAIDQVIPPLNEIRLRSLSICRSDRSGCEHGRQQNHPNCHDVPHSWPALGLRELGYS